MDDINLEAALSRMDGPPRIPREACFPLGRRLHTQRRKDLLKVAARRAARQFIKPENADDIVAALPMEEGDSTHGIIPGMLGFHFPQFAKPVGNVSLQRGNNGSGLFHVWDFDAAFVGDGN